MPVGIIAGAISAAAAGAAAMSIISVTAAMAISAVASVAAALLTKTPSVDFNSYKSQAERKQIIRCAASPVTVVYGETMGSGLMAFAEEEPGYREDDYKIYEWVHIALVIAGHQIESIQDIFLGDQRIQDLSTVATWELHNNRTTCDPFMKSHCPSWKDDMIGKGIAWIRLSLLSDQEKFPSGLPNIRIVKRGRKCYDPRSKQTVWTNNAALVILDYYRNYLKIADSAINWDQFQTAANICGEYITLPDNTRQQRYTINGEFDLNEPRAKIIEAMLEACAGELTFSGGKHGLLVGAYYGPSTMTITSSDICGDIKIVGETSYRDRTNTITGTFIDPVQNYTEVDYPKVTVAEWVTQDGRELISDSSYRFVTSEFQAQRLSAIKLRRKRIGRMLEVPVNMRGFRMRPGFYVNVTIPELQMNNVEFRICEWKFDPKSGIVLTLKQEGADVWGDVPGVGIVRPPLIDLPTGGIAAPDQLAVVSQAIGESVQSVITWVNHSQFVSNLVKIYNSANQLVYSVEVPSPAQLCRLNGLLQGNYTAKISAKALNGAVSPASALVFTIAAPPTPTAVDISTTNSSISLKPKFATSIAYGTMCEFWFSTKPLALANVEAQATLKGTAAQLVHDGLRFDTTYYYYIRSVNAYGKSGFLAVEAKTTKTNTDILALLDGAITDTQLIASLKEKIASSLNKVEVGAIVDTAVNTVTGPNSALAQQIDKVESKANQNTTAVETVATAQSGLEGKVNSGWYTKAQINGVGGGFGLSVVLQPDGSVMTTFLIDADVFGVLGRNADGSAAKINPFVIKNGIVYINKAMMDDAEIGQIIAKYIDVKNLTAVTINGGTITAATIQSSGNPPTFQLTPDGRLVARNADISGTINATSGKFSNVTIDSTCDIKYLRAEVIDGDLTKAFLINKNGTVTIPAQRFARKLVMPSIVAGSYGYTVQGGGSNPQDKWYCTTSFAEITINGTRRGTVSGPGLDSFSIGQFLNTGIFVWDIPANTSITVGMYHRLTNGYNPGLNDYINPSAIILVFKQ